MGLRQVQLQRIALHLSRICLRQWASPAIAFFDPGSPNLESNKIAVDFATANRLTPIMSNRSHFPCDLLTVVPQAEFLLLVGYEIPGGR